MAEDRPVQVLMVDDDEDDFVIVRDLLRDAGDGRYELTWVDSFDGGLRRACDRRGDVMLVEYWLGAWGGVRVVRGAAPRGCDGAASGRSGDGWRAGERE